jgi:hypothetical protein
MYNWIISEQFTSIPIVPILIAVGVILFFFLSSYYDAKRRQAIERWAMLHQLSFNREEDHHFCSRYPEFDCLTQGDNYYAFNTLTGQWNARPFLGFDYHYETHSTNSKGQRQTHHHYFSGVIIQTDFILNPLVIRPEGFFDKITEFFGYDDIDFESAEFSRKFYVKSSDKRWAYDVIHPRMMEFLLASPMFNIQFGLKYIIVYRDSKFAPVDFEFAGSLICGMLDRFPEYLIKQQKEG